MPPTRSCVGGVPLPPELLFELEGGGVGFVVPELPLPPAPATLTLALEIADANDAWLEDCEDTDADTDVASVAGVDIVCAELALEASFWKDVLGFVDLEIEAMIAETLVIEDCDAVGSGRREEDIVLDSELRLLGLKENVVEARERSVQQVVE